MTTLNNGKKKKTILFCFVICLILKKPQVKGGWLPILNATESSATLKRSVQRAIFFYSKTWMVIYHFDLIALITKDGVTGFFFLKRQFSLNPAGRLKKCAKCLLHAFPITARLISAAVFLFVRADTFQYPSTLHCFENYRFKTLSVTSWQ